MSTTSPPTLSEQDLTVLAEDFLDALLSAADLKVIGKNNWWDRAKSALETAAASSATWPACVARACKKLQISTPDTRLSAEVDKLAKILGDERVYLRWARLAARDAVYVTAMVRARRDQRHADRKTTQTPKAAAVEVDPDALPGF